MFKKILIISLALVFSATTIFAATPRQATLILVSIGKDISKKIKSRQPFVNYLAKHLRSEGIEKGQVKVVEGIPQVASMINSGEADIFVDSPFPVLMVDYLADIKYPLRRWKRGVAEYSSIIFTRKDSGIRKLEDLKGNMISFEERFSTSGYFLPKSLLLDRKLTLKLKRSLNAPVSSDEIGYIFSEGDETTMVWVLRKRIQAGAIDRPNFFEDARDQVSHLHILYQTEPVPRNLFAHRSNLDKKLISKMKAVLLKMDQTREGREILTSYQKTRKFDNVPSKSIAVLDKMKRYIKLELDDQ
ncbi:MAG: phosphate/phosphite/phosphonate ABC transporter substrate-binding protein [Proteobacteria bacterium]|nr:phosphate/phosphite/phosphonate ABC transporter substrate-binding protein [Pseudomonadota bacterium]